MAGSASRQDSSTSRDALWPNSARTSRSYDSPADDMPAEEAAAFGPAGGRIDERSADLRAAEDQGSAGPSILTPSGIIAQLRWASLLRSQPVGAYTMGNLTQDC